MKVRIDNQIGSKIAMAPYALDFGGDWPATGAGTRYITSQRIRALPDVAPWISGDGIVCVVIDSLTTAPMTMRFVNVESAIAGAAAPSTVYAGDAIPVAANEKKSVLVRGWGISDLSGCIELDFGAGTVSPAVTQANIRLRVGG